MKQVYICFSTDILHNGHIRILQRAAELGEVTVGLLTDEVVASYKHYPLIPLEERIAMFEGLKYVSRVVVQESLDYTDILNRLRPDIVVHGDDWLVGYQANIRQKVIETLKGWGGELVEFPYTHTATEETLSTLDQLLSLPETRRSRLRRLLQAVPVRDGGARRPDRADCRKDDRRNAQGPPPVRRNLGQQPVRLHREGKAGY